MVGPGSWEFSHPGPDDTTPFSQKWSGNPVAFTLGHYFRGLGMTISGTMFSGDLSPLEK